jgi:hypothetical protein
MRDQFIWNALTPRSLSDVKREPPVRQRSEVPVVGEYIADLCGLRVERVHALHSGTSRFLNLFSGCTFRSIVSIARRGLLNEGLDVPWFLQQRADEVIEFLKWLVERKITPHVPVWDKSARHDGTFSRADFLFDQERNVYICPGGAELTSTGNIDQGHIVYYRANKHDCSACSLKPKCTTAAMRKVTRDVNEDVRDRLRALANTEAFQQSRRERKKGRDAVCSYENAS